MPAYIEQYDLPCYPNPEPRPHSRVACCIEEGSVFDSEFVGYSLWVGGCGIAKARDLDEARRKLHTHVRDSLEQQHADALRQAAYYKDLLDRWGTHERHMMRFEAVSGQDED